MENIEFDTYITPQRNPFDFNIKELVNYKDLIWLFVKRNFTSQYKQTILGPLWFVLNPLITTFISTLIFGNIAKIESDGVPYFLFYISGYTLWNYFSTCVSQTSSTFTDNAGIMGKVYFPRLTMPISSVIYSAVNMVIVFCMTLLTMLYFRLNGVNIEISWLSLLIPILMLQTAVLGLGVGIIISSLTTKYRDLAVLVGFGLQLWMYLTPVVYPITDVSGPLRTLLFINPMTAVIQNFKFFLLGTGEYCGNWWLVSWIMTVVLFLCGVLLFNRVERTFMDTV